MKTGWKFAFVILGTIFSVGMILYLAQKPSGDAVLLRPPPTPMPIKVHVSGGIMVEGVYTLPVGSRVLDAIEAAGGLAPEANPAGINLASYLEDGEYIFIPAGSTESELFEGLDHEILDNNESDDYSLLININTANQEVLETLPGIGPVLAEEIISYRETQGYFENIEEVIEVRGIGQVIFDQIRELITVGDLP